MFCVKLVLFSVVLAGGFVGTWTQCYRMKMLSTSTSETADYRLVMFLHNNQTISSITTVHTEVPIPMWQLILIQHNVNVRLGSKDQQYKVLYNSTYKVCQFWRYLHRIRVFNNVADLIFNGDNMGNMSLKCPLAVGTYVMQNIRVPPDTGILKLMYWPNTLYTLQGRVYSLGSDKKRTLKATYEINATVIKTC